MSKRLPVTLIVDNVRSLYNVGAIFRSADAVNLEAIYLCGLTGYPKIANDTRAEWVAQRADKEIRKTGLAGVDSVPFRYLANVNDAIVEVKKKKYILVALEKTGESVDYRAVDYQFPLAVVVGHEVDGVSGEVLKMADRVVHLPMLGEGKSLNVATATSAFLYYLLDKHSY